jgi:hypothetical protein
VNPLSDERISAVLDGFRREELPLDRVADRIALFQRREFLDDLRITCGSGLNTIIGARGARSGPKVGRWH